jgi:hypothetical protein
MKGIETAGFNDKQPSEVAGKAGKASLYGGALDK